MLCHVYNKQYKSERLLVAHPNNDHDSIFFTVDLFDKKK